MSKISLTNLVNLQNETTAVNAINANNAVLTTALDNSLSRDGTSPNTMSASLDMNSHTIINLSDALTPQEPVTLGQLNNMIVFLGDPVLGLANPSVSIGLTANNGVGVNAMRSDSTPALSQAIVPTWTGKHKWIFPSSTTGDSVVEIIHGTSGSPVTTVQAKHSGIRVERWLNKTVASSSTRATGVQGDALSVGLFEAFPTSGSQQTFALRGGVFVGTPRASGSAVTDMVGVYAEAQRTTGTDGVWAMNSVTEVTNLSGATIGYEIDINNRSGSDPGVNPTNSFWGLSVINGDTDRGGTAIHCGRNGALSNNEWNRGIYLSAVKKIGLEIGNAWAGLANGTILFQQLNDTDDMINGRRKTDTTPTGKWLKFQNAAGTVNIFTVENDGEVRINTPDPALTSALAAKQIANGEDTIILQRNTDSTPTGQFFRCVNAANSTNLFIVDFNSTAAETNLRVSLAGAAATRVSVGAADTGAAGFRLLRIPN